DGDRRAVRRGANSSAAAFRPGLAKGHGFIRAGKCGRDCFLLAFRPCSVAQRLKPVKGIITRWYGTTKVVPFRTSLRHD
ncbi:MAG: hypothetical protein MUP80_12105, partial [Acidobacteriia bacterium]|nr:hypothetical protein [Terriglobia bacterium]